MKIEELPSGILAYPILCPPAPLGGVWVFLDFSLHPLFLPLPTESCQRDGRTPIFLPGVMRTTLHIFCDIVQLFSLFYFSL